MKIDAKGKACPTPVIMTKNALEEITEGILTVCVDNYASKENVIKFATSKGHSCEFVEDAGIFTIDIAVGYPCDIPKSISNIEKREQNIVLFVASDSIGDEADLGKKLMNGFICNIINMDLLPRAIIFVNSGVNITTLNNDTIDALLDLAEKDIEILSCGACLTHYKIEHQLKVGEISDAHRVMTRLFEADKVIRL